MVNNIKTFDERIKELVALGKEQGYLTYEQLAKKTGKYPDVKYGFKLGYKNIGFNGKFYTFPYFLTFLLKRFLNSNHVI